MRTLFYKLPRLTSVILLVILVGGIGAVLMLPRQEDPLLVERFGYVLTVQPGATAEQMEALITEPLENSLLDLDELEKIDSVSRAGVSQIGLKIRDDLSESEVDDAWTLIRGQVEAARASFPQGTRAPFVKRSYLGASTLLVGIIWEGEGEAPLTLMRRMALDIEDKLQRLPGVAVTDVFGLPAEEIRVIVDADALAAAGLGLRQAAALIAAADAKAPAGTLRAEGGNIGMEVEGEFDSIARIMDVPLLQHDDGSALRVRDIAQVRKGLEDPLQRMQLINNKTAILVNASVAAGQRVDLWSKQAQEIIDAVAVNTPDGMKIETVFSQAEYTSARLNGLSKNMMFSALIVFAVLFFVMGWRAAIAVGLALPLTVALVLILFNIFGHPLHQMSVTGLIISLGLLIDNAIVVVDEFDQKRARGVSRLVAIDESIRHLFAPLGASTLTTALAFAPIAMLPGPSGEFVGMIGVSVIFSIVSSFILSITVIPAVAGFIDRQRGWEKGAAARPHRWWRDGIAIGFISDGYRASIEAILRFPPLGILIGIAPAIFGFYLASSLPSQFFPQTERDQFQLDVSMPPEATLADIEALTRRATDLLLGYEGVERVSWTIGEAGPRVYYNAVNITQGVVGRASGWVDLDSPERTHEIVAQIQMDMRDEFPEALFLALPYEQGPPAPAPIEFFIQGEDLETLNRLGDELRLVLAQTPGVTYTAASLQLGRPTVKLRADETMTGLSGVRLSELAGQLNAELEGVRAGSILEGTEELPVRIIASTERRGSLLDLRSKTIGARPGDAGTPISSLAEMELSPETAIITRQNGQRINQILGYLDPYILPAPVNAAFEKRLAEMNYTLPAGYTKRIGGNAENSGNAMGGLAGVGIPLVLVMALAITLVFNSFRMMALIMTTGFLSIGLAFFGVWLFNLPLGFNAIIGALGLLGISINGSIVVLSMLRASPEALADNVIAQREIIVDASRHIVATTLTTMGGFVPLLVQGDSFWMPFAAAIAGGVAGSALLALYFTPAVFRLMTLKPMRKLMTWLLLGKQAKTSQEPA